MPLYSPNVPATNRFGNMDANSLASGYAAQYGHASNQYIARIVRDTIYDAAPAAFFDLKILNAMSPEVVGSDEFFYDEVGYGRSAILTTATNIHGAGGVDINAGSTQTFNIQNPEEIAKDMIIGRGDSADRGTVTAISGTLVTITAETNKTLSAMTNSIVYTWYNHSPVEADGMNTFSQYYRIDTIERTNYVQAILKAQRFGKRELAKYLNSGIGRNYISIQRQRMMQQFRIDISNIYWNGNMAEVTLADGHKAKTARGIFPTLQQAGSPNTTATLSLAAAAIEEMALDTEFGSEGEVKFLYATPRAIHYVAQQYKRDLTRYEPDNMVANLGLNEINIGSTRIVFVPMRRFEDAASFPAAFRKRMFLLDQKSIAPVIQFGEETGDTLPRGSRGTRENYSDVWISADFSIRFSNPLGSGYIDISDLP